MTNRLYYQDATLRTFTARVVARQDTARGPAVQLDQTAFYPTSGGQPHDTGALNGSAVLDVWEDDDGAVWHLLAQAIAADEVTGEIDWARRFDHMQQHTGQHLLSEEFMRAHNAQTIGFHLGSEASTIDLDIPHLSWEHASRVEDAVNRIVWENRAVNIHFVTRDELANIPLRKPPQVTGEIRVIWVADYDASACGGTHVSRTGEIGIVKITGIERYKGGVRVEFLCGARALRDYQRALRMLQRTSAALSVHQDELHDAVTRIQDDAKSAHKALEQARGELMEVAADRLWEETPAEDGIKRIVAHWDDRTFADARVIAARLRERSRTLLLLAVTEEKGVRLVCARSANLPDVNAGTILRAALDPLEGRGGGPPEIAQGGAPHHTHDEIMDALARAVS